MREILVKESNISKICNGKDVQMHMFSTAVRHGILHKNMSQTIFQGHIRIKKSLTLKQIWFAHENDTTKYLV